MGNGEWGMGNERPKRVIVGFHSPFPIPHSPLESLSLSRSKTMMNRNRRDFLADVGRGMLIASLGPAVSFDLGLARAFADDAPQALSFGKIEPLVALMQETAPDKLQAVLVEKLAGGTELRTLVAAGALANARTFGGEDYTGFHAFLALAPALPIADKLPEARRALPGFKGLYRNTTRIQEKGGRKNEILHPNATRAGP